MQLSENIRHNKQTEYKDLANLSEVKRSNRVHETQTWGGMTETQRHNLASEMTNQLAAESRMRMADEASRHNVAQEGIARQSNAITAARDKANASIAKANSAINEYNAHTQRYASRNQKREIDAKIAKYKQDIQTAKVQNVVSVWNQVNNSANQIISILRGGLLKGASNGKSKW